MPRAKADNFSKVILNENIYIYKKISGKFYSNKTVDGLFASVKKEKDDYGSKKLDAIIIVQEPAKMVCSIGSQDSY
jgi:hypothetical protein